MPLDFSKIELPALYNHIGVTGPREGITQAQVLRLGQALKILWTMRGATTLHHGDCTGADAQAVGVAKAFGYRIVCHPPIWPVYRAFVGGDEIRAEKEYHPRNRDIVDEVDLLIGLPATVKPTPKSGTWYTIGYAQGNAVPVCLILPDGEWVRG